MRPLNTNIPHSPVHIPLDLLRRVHLTKELFLHALRTTKFARTGPGV
jgi:hypothetical protein